MKACAAVAGVLVGLALVVAAALFVVPRLKAGNPSAPTTLAGSGGQSFGPPADRINPPVSDTQKLRDEIDRKRIPFFHMIHDRFADQVEHASVLNDIDTLDLVVKKSDEQSLQWLVANAIGPTARDYGFTRVRFYVKNPIGSVDPYKIVAESSWDGTSRWNTFVK